MSHLGGFRISSPISQPRCTVESSMTTMSIAARAMTVSFWTFVITDSNQ
jgi:hypothetical protein